MASDAPQLADRTIKADVSESNERRRPADLVIRAGAIHPMSASSVREAVFYLALAVRGSRVFGLSPDSKGLDALVGEETVVIDDHGLTLVPTFDDTHTHLIFAGRAVNDVQVADAKNLDEFLQLIRRQAEATAKGQWIRTASNWHELRLAERRLPTAQELDSATSDHPVLVKRGGHNDVVNTYALRLAEITADTAALKGGVIGHDSQGQPTGLLQDAALSLVETLLPSPSFDAQLDGLRRASADYAARGIGAVRDAAVNPDEIALLQAARDHDLLAVRTQAMVLVGFAGQKSTMGDFLDQLDQDGTRPGAGDDRFRVWGIKFVLDGGIENGALEQPYANQPDYTGELQWEADELTDAVGQAAGRGWKVGVHAWGDRAVRTLLDAYERVLDANRSLRSESLVVEHGGLARPEQRARAIRLGVPITVQHPLLSGLAAPLVEYWGRERVEDIFPLREWLDEGAHLSAGSDFPNGRYDAMASLWGMTTRQTPVAAVGPEHAISRYEAARLHTADAARFVGEESIRGSLAPGMFADFAAYRSDPLSCPIDELALLLPALTVVGGVAVHDPESIFPNRHAPKTASTARPGVPANSLPCC